MGNLLFSPSGRIGPGQFMSGVKILVIIAVVLAILPAFVPALVMLNIFCLLYTSPSPRDQRGSRMPSSA